MEFTTAWEKDILLPRAETGAEAAVRAEASDSHLVEAILAGNEDAFEQLFDRYKRLVGAAAARYFQQPEQIEEIIQITFSKVFFELKDFRGEHDFSLASWMGRIAINTCLNTIRSAKRRPEDRLGDMDDVKADALLKDMTGTARNNESLLIERDLAEKLLASLPADDRGLLNMLYVEEMSAGEISQLTGLSVANVKVRSFRARNALRKIVRRFL
jgi:RNA polymerase sigma-70 factor (ECF subfamily)